MVEDVISRDKLKFLLGERATDEFIDWLEEIGYFECPASISHHGNKSRGLVKHSMMVAKTLIDFTMANKLKWDDESSPAVIGMLHDICKCDDYIIKGFEDTDDVWEYNKDGKIMDGHGDKSVLMLAGHFPLTEQEARCIQFHMGSFTDKEQWKYYTRAVSKDVNVLYTHAADMIASQVEEV